MENKDFANSFPISVQRSGGGYYVGQADEYGIPFSRLSEYYDTKQACKAALDQKRVLWRTWAMENKSFNFETMRWE